MPCKEGRGIVRDWEMSHRPTLQCEKSRTLTSPQRPTTSLTSFLPTDRPTMHRLTALPLCSALSSSSFISTQPSERTANRIG